MFKNHLSLFPKRFYSTNNTSVLNVYKNKNLGEKIRIQGWVKGLRKLKENIFFDVNDGSCNNKLQVVIPSAQKPQSLSTGCSVTVSGLLNASPKGQVELNAENVEIHGECKIEDGYPYAPRKSYTNDYVRQYLHFRPRTNKFSSLLRIRDYANLAIHNYFSDEGYVNVHTPILTSNDCEGAGEVFTVLPENQQIVKDMITPNLSPQEAYFRSKVFLTVSGQLQLEAAVHSLSKVYTFGPTFRAENSKSRLHLSEFYMLEAECAFLDKIEQVTEIVEKLIKEVTKKVLNKYVKDIEMHNEHEIDFSWVDKEFIKLTYDEAISILNKNKDKKCYDDFNETKGLTKEHEHFLVRHCGGVPTFVINWPKHLKPFYMKSCDDDWSKVAAFDLLVPIVGEMVGGSLRENDYATLKEKLPKGADLEWYLDIRKFGGVPTGGFGLGFERYLQFILGVNNIKDTIPFPRWPHNCKL